MALLSLATLMERAGGVHSGVHDDLHGVQVLPLHGQPDTDGEADQVVQATIYRSELKRNMFTQESKFRSSNHLLAWFLCLLGSEEMVGAILQAALARYYCYLS